MPTDIERELLNSAQTDPSPALRQRILAVANPLVQPHASRLDAIWFSPRWRVAAVLVFFGLVAADALSSATAGVEPQVDGLAVRSSVELAVQAAVDAGLERAEVAAIAAQASLPWTTDVDATRGGRMELTGPLR